MRVFVTGASGFVGTTVVEELIAKGHEVVGVARSDKSAEHLTKLGATVHRGDLSDPKGLAEGARNCDGVIHCAFIHDFANLQQSIIQDRLAAGAILDALEGSNKPFVLTSGLAFLPADVLNTEDSFTNETAGFAARAVVERTTIDAASRGIRTVVVRLSPTVHDANDHGFIPMIIGTCREKKLAAYAGDGTNTWPAVHRRDAARLYVLGLEKAPAGSVLHAVGEEGVQWNKIATAIGEGLHVPVKSLDHAEFAAHYGWMGHVVGKNLKASSAKTQALVGWKPEGKSLLEDMRANYFGGEK